MSEPHNLHNALQEFTYSNGKTGKYYSLPALEAAGIAPLSKLPVSIPSFWNPFSAPATASASKNTTSPNSPTDLSHATSSHPQIQLDATATTRSHQYSTLETPCPFSAHNTPRLLSARPSET